jgi:hypothetical protein
MFEVKSYCWLLQELARTKSKLKILEIAFVRGQEISEVFHTSFDGSIEITGKKLTLSATLESFLQRSQMQNKNYEEKAAIYACSETSARILNGKELKASIKKPSKLFNIREIIKFQEHLHESKTFFSMQVHFNGNELESRLFRKEIDSKDEINDTSFMYLALNIMKHLVEMVENFTKKNVVRLKFHFIIDKHYTLYIIHTALIKLVHPKVLLTYKSLDVERLENLISLKNEFKGPAIFIKSRFKEPDIDPLTPKPSAMHPNLNIFATFVSSFLQIRKTDRKNTWRSSSIGLVEDGPGSRNESCMKIETPGLSEFLSESPSPIELKNAGRVIKVLKLPKIKSQNSIKGKVSMVKDLFPSLQPSPTLGILLKTEELRIKESQDRRLAHSGNLEKFFPKIGKKKRLRKVKKKVKSFKDETGKKKSVSPYCMKNF